MSGCSSWFFRNKVSPASPGASPRSDELAKFPSRSSTGTFQTSLSGLSKEPGAEEDSEDDEMEKMDHTGSQFVMKESNKFRKVWTGVVTLLLLYIATWFLFQLTFLDLHKPEPMHVPEFLGMDPSAWQAWSILVDGLFWVDSFVYFFFSFQDERGREVDCWPRIIKRYACGSFVVNIIACLPEEAAGEMMKVFTGGGSGSDTNAHQAARTMRLQRASRLFRLARIGRLAKLTAMKSSPLWKWLQTLRGVRIINVLVGLFFSVHLLACGWYMCAALHADVQATWLARRYVDPLQVRNLLDDSDPGLQWLHAMYFILTVFTTVGFGDISAFTPGEILYVVLTFLIGAVVHSIIIGEVISAVTRVDERGQFVTEQRGLMEKFASHTELNEDCVVELQNWVCTEATKWMTQKYDKESVRSLLTGRHMYRSLESMLPPMLFKGQFVANKFFANLPSRMPELPPRLPMLLALNSHRQFFQKQEVIYQRQDFANCLFLVTSGIFSHVGVPYESGGQEVGVVCSGVDQWLASSIRKSARSANSDPPIMSAYQIFTKGNYFGEHGALFNIPRASTARCEARGSCIVVPKSEVLRSMRDFPEFSSLWTTAASSRERYRADLLRRLTRPRHYKQLAASQIQRRWRRRRDLSKTEMALEQTAYSSEDDPKQPGTPLTPIACRTPVTTIVAGKDRVGDPFKTMTSAVMVRADTRAGEDWATRTLGINNNEEMTELMKEIRLLRSEITMLRREREVAPPSSEPQLIGQVG